MRRTKARHLFELLRQAPGGDAPLRALRHSRAPLRQVVGEQCMHPKQRHPDKTPLQVAMEVPEATFQVAQRPTHVQRTSITALHPFTYRNVLEVNETDLFRVARHEFRTRREFRRQQQVNAQREAGVSIRSN